MITCANGHESGTVDYCDVCGTPIGAAQVPDPDQLTVPAEPCPGCGAQRDGRFCESCGHDFDGPPPDADMSTVDPAESSAVADAAAWTAVAVADHGYFDRVVAEDGPDAPAMEFPPFCPERRFPLVGSQVQIGRRSNSRGIRPDIDLSGPPADPGVSHLHALLVPDDDGWAVVDVQSTNGITINDGDSAIARNTPIALADGDRVHLGAWTTITVHRS